jgi:hypothetical protein
VLTVARRTHHFPSHFSHVRPMAAREHEHTGQVANGAPGGSHGWLVGIITLTDTGLPTTHEQVYESARRDARFLFSAHLGDVWTDHQLSPGPLKKEQLTIVLICSLYAEGAVEEKSRSGNVSTGQV